MPNLYFFTGEDTYRLQEQVSGWQKAFVEKHGDLNLSMLSAGEHTIPEMISQIETAPFLGDKRLIFLKELPVSAVIKNTDDAKEEELLKAIQDLPETSIVVFVQAKPDKRKSFYKQLIKIAEVKTFEPLKGVGITQWVQKQAAVYGGSISSATAQQLVNHSGEDLWKLDSELKKLATYAGSAPITQEMIETLAVPNYEANIFKLTDAMSVKNRAAALKELSRLQAAGESLHQVLYMLARQIRILIQIKETSDPNSLKLHPFVLRNASSQAKNFTAKELKTAHAQLLGIDAALKTGKIRTAVGDERELALAIEQVLIRSS